MIQACVTTVAMAVPATKISIRSRYLHSPPYANETMATGPEKVMLLPVTRLMPLLLVTLHNPTLDERTISTM